MKRVQLIFCAMLLTAFVAFSQQQPGTKTQAPPEKGSTPPPAATQAPQQQPGSGKPLPQAKTQEEFKAFQEAMVLTQKGDPVASEAAADAFASKFKDSEITTIIYGRAMQLYADANNSDKAIEVGNKILAISPNDPIANVQVATFVASRVSDSDLDKNDRLAEAEKDANRSLQTVDTDFLANPGTPQDAIDSAKNMIRSMAYSALAICEAAKMNYPAAENYFVKASNLPGTPLDAVTLLRYALVLDKQKKYAQALVIANQSFNASPAGSREQELAKSERDRLTLLTGSSVPVPSPNPSAQAPKQ